ncbi:zinc finger protein 862-like [Mytilus californianus]|uniref:zinc finger protein 862-like n=1 Tax=Mytilus californianus TaxID=6549 RepID=UPI0022481178|nr:zinc finger protein 862-like [Mytilus californianus]
MPPKKQRIVVLPGQKTLLSFVGRDKNNNSENVEEMPQTSNTNTDIPDENMAVDEDPKELEHDKRDGPGEGIVNKDPRKYRPVWEKLWPWLLYDGTKMYCKSCQKAGKKNSLALGCTTFKTSTMSRHQETPDHKQAISVPVHQQEFTKSCNKLNSAEDEAVILAMMAVYWLASEDLPLNKYESMINFLKKIGVTKLENLKVNERTNYESYYSATEILDVIDSEIESEIDEKISKSPYVTILADESTDISNRKKITINARIINPETSIPETVFLRDKSYADGTGEGLTSVIIEEMAKHKITNDKLIGFGSDGATVMSGSDKGVKGRLMELNPHMVHIHCMAHRLALCTSQAAEGVPLMKHYQEWLTSVFYYFKASPTREGELHEVQSVLNLPILKCKEIHAVRWLSCFEAVQAVYRSLDALISYFHKRQASKDPKAKGLLKKMATTSFIYITYMLMDVLPIVSKLCLTLQKQDLDVAVAKVRTTK